jgi:hypothetical protein
MTTEVNTKSTKKLKVLKILDLETAKKYIPFEESRVIPKIWELPTRKTFFNWVLQNYKSYIDLKPKQSEEKPARLDLFPQQKLVRDFMSDQSPYRGLLLYHGLGVGKTCASIAISQTITDPDKEVWVFSKASLEGNYIKGIKECGMDVVRNQNNWVFIEGQSEIEKEIIKKYQIPSEVVKENGGAFIINYEDNTPNYNDLSVKDQIKLDYQINYILNKRFKFKHLDDTRLLQKLETIGKFPFDNKVLIFDEVHNLINSVATESKIGVAFERHLMAAKNCKIIFLTGTPLVNDVFEAAKIFNILRGPITTYTFRFVDYAEDINWNLIKTTLKRNIYIDQIIIKRSQKMISVTQNPDNYINHPDGIGIVYQKDRKLTPDRFEDLVKKQINGLGYKVITNKEVNTALPNTKKEFDALFYNRDMNRLKKTDVIKKRIMGMLSFYDPPVQSLMPEVTKIEKVFVEMSDLQAKQYQKARNEEIEKNKKMKKKAGRDMDKIKTSYRIFSRMACTFAFPEELGSPYEDAMEILEKVDEDEQTSDSTRIDTSFFNEENEKNIAKFDMLVKKTYLKKLDKGKDKYLGMKNGSLARHSPKYLKMIEKIEQSPGCVFVYSQFITLIGLNTFCLSLEATGKYVEFDIKKENGYWVLNNPPEDDDKIKYVTWAGDKDKEKRELIKMVFNGELDLLPTSCQILKTQLKEKYGDEMNKHGNVIKIFMTTKTGAEGISLFNVRQVHIMEPYWQPVLIDQVIGRAVRTGSHMSLPASERNVEVYVYLATYTQQQLKNTREPNLRGDIARFNDGLQKRGQIVTSDESLYIISERKKNVIDVFLKLIKEVAFDCNIHANMNFNPNKPFKCLDYDSKNRDEYLSAPSIMDTVGLAEEHQEQNIQVAMGEFSVKGIKYYYELNLLPGQKRFIYTNSILGAGRAKPVGELIEKNGKTFPAFYKKKSTSRSKSASKSSDKAKKMTKKIKADAKSEGKKKSLKLK